MTSGKFIVLCSLIVASIALHLLYFAVGVKFTGQLAGGLNNSLLQARIISTRGPLPVKPQGPRYVYKNCVLFIGVEFAPKNTNRIANAVSQLVMEYAGRTNATLSSIEKQKLLNEFQTKNRLRVTGVVDRTTFNKIKNICGVK